MRRVLDRNGRLALSVWNNVGIYNTAEADFSDVEVSVSRINVHLPQIALSNGALGAMSAPQCPLLGAKRTRLVALPTSAFDPKRTPGSPFKALSSFDTMPLLSLGARA